MLALFLHIAGIFLILGAQFLAAVQVIVYAGAILIFYLFVLMLLDLPGEEARSPFGKQWPFAYIAGLSFTALVWLAMVRTYEPFGASVVAAAESAAVDDASLGGIAEVGRGQDEMATVWIILTQAAMQIDEAVPLAGLRNRN